MQPVRIDAFQYRCYRIAICDDDAWRSASLADYRSVGRPYDQSYAPTTETPSTMSIDEQRVKRFFRGEKRKAEKAVNVAKKDIKRTVNDVENVFRPPWYRRISDKTPVHKTTMIQIRIRCDSMWKHRNIWQ
ncbi:hypothetical protein NECAME_07315 [Necator americanus]|uniref:Uncharacterized protein n=1 Tax=Necator americanus TaxID=51031 RepID=W2TR52_NECAM|nr:hypothetical protein NECAME_07315 [Necator americanus]ETN83606.1 hypothetical protein NECAME_07315 [Necator americanus]